MRVFWSGFVSRERLTSSSYVTPSARHHSWNLLRAASPASVIGPASEKVSSVSCFFLRTKPTQPSSLWRFGYPDRRRAAHSDAQRHHAVRFRWTQHDLPRRCRHLRRHNHQGQPGPDQTPPGLGVRQVAGEEAGEGEPRNIEASMGASFACRDGGCAGPARDARSIPRYPRARPTSSHARVSPRDPREVAKPSPHPSSPPDRPPLTPYLTLSIPSQAAIAAAEAEKAKKVRA